ncbi:MAG: hypothetical protein ACR2NM_04865, partial [Bythopirellula sp.]
MILSITSTTRPVPPRGGFSQFFAAFVLVALAGCGSSRPDEFQISGRIIFDGQPVPAGYILFDP